MTDRCISPARTDSSRVSTLAKESESAKRLTLSNRNLTGFGANMNPPPRTGDMRAAFSKLSTKDSFRARDGYG